MNNCSLLLHLKTVLKNGENWVRMEALETLSILLSQKGEIQSVINSSIFTYLIEIISTDEYLRPKIAKLFKFASRASSGHIKYFVDAGIIASLCKALGFFKVYDTVLTKVYKYYGATYNFEFANDVLLALDNVKYFFFSSNFGLKIVNMGETDSENSVKFLNPYALKCDLESVDKIGSLIQAIKDEEHKQEVDSWRTETLDQVSLEDKAKLFLKKIQKVHDLNLKGFFICYDFIIIIIIIRS